MDDPSQFQRPRSYLPEPLIDPNEVAEAADIPRPRERVLEDELAAQGRRKDLQDFGTLPRNLMEAVLLIQAMEREGRRVERNPEALMDFLRHQKDGDVLSADLLVATALMMEAIPKARKKMGWSRWQRWITRLKQAFGRKS